ncbi:MAG: hypothetical protein OER85_08090 [Gammaproteobacteria bacterium]|nr:hypothetical protein [Gammaproteobacteria bacterium]
MAEDSLKTEIKMDPRSLYREEVFTDRRIGTIQRLTPVDGDGQPIDGGTVLYMGQTQLMTPAGALPLSFELQADSLGQAAEKFADGANAAMEEAVKRLEELRREQASSIIVPGAGGGVPGGGLQM